ncbi:hypothetical protein Q5Z23_34630, partial [Pseudomonas aeruginosa]|uniref:hypothetical protein n=1 Tax=Pseudomonas aeruginosa TaxID=287 RepID=UPI0027122C9B
VDPWQSVSSGITQLAVAPKSVPGEVVPVEPPNSPPAPRSILGRVFPVETPQLAVGAEVVPWQSDAAATHKNTTPDRDFLMAHHPARMARSIRAWAE